MDPVRYVQEEFGNVERALIESLRYDYGPGRTADYYDECRFRLTIIGEEVERLVAAGSGPTASIIQQLWDLATRLTLVERSHLGEFSWPFADVIRKLATSLLTEEESLEGSLQPIVHVMAEGTSYQIVSERILSTSKRRRLFTVAFPRQLKQHVLMHALFGHELGHATFYSDRPSGDLLFSTQDPPSRKIIQILRREGPLQNCTSAMNWLMSQEAPDEVSRMQLDLNQARITEGILEHWVVELVCDLFGLAIFGPAFAAAHRAYLEPSCRTPYEIDIKRISHPAFVVRRAVLIDALQVKGWLDPVATSNNPEVEEAENQFMSYIGGSTPIAWASVFTEAQHRDVFQVIDTYFKNTGTPLAQRPDEDMLVELVTRIAARLPPLHERLDDDGVPQLRTVRIEEQLYAGWTYWLGRGGFDNEEISFFQLNQLCDLAILQQQAVDSISAASTE